MSLVLDVVLALVLLAYAVRGWRVGFARSVGALAGVVAGGFAAAALAPFVAGLVPDPTARTVVSVVAVVVPLLAGHLLGSAVGGMIGGLLRRSPLGPVDRVLGSGAQLVVSALVISVLASLAVSAGLTSVAQPVAGSFVLQTIDRITPHPVEQVLAQLGSTVAAQAAGTF